MTLIDSDELRRKLGNNYSDQHIRRLIKAGVLPPPVRMGLGKNGKRQWIEAEVDACVNARIAAKIEERNAALAAKQEGKAPAQRAA